MNDQEAQATVMAMKQYIKSHGDEKVAIIMKQADEEFKQQMDSYIAEEKERIINDYKVRIQQDEIKLKIQRSAAENARRIQKMKTVNQLVEKLYKEAKHKMISKQKTDTNQYKELLKNLIVQGLIKFMEAEVHVRCRQSDLATVQTVMDQAADEYKKLMKKEVKIFKDRDVPLKLILDNDRFLPEYDDNEGSESCLGGVVLHAKRGKIVCSNTLDDRLGLVYQEAIPEIRKTLFPSFKKKAVEKPQQEAVKHHH